MNSPIRLLAALTLALAVSAANAAEVLNLNFDEGTGTTAADSLLSDGTATPDDSVTLQNGAGFAAGFSGTALEMPTTTAPWAHAVFDSTSIGDLLVSAPGGTFACRMMIPSALWSANTNKDKGNLIFIGRAGSSTLLRFGLQTRRNAAFRLLARCNDSDSAASIQTGTGMFRVDEWIHIAAVADYAAATLAIYTNGQIAFKTNGVTQWGGATICSSAASTNGAVGMNWPNTDEAFIGRLDDVRFWNEPLSDAQVAALVGPAPAPTIPVITQAVVTAGSFILRGTNGSANGSYEVLSAQSLATSSTTWPAISTNNFDAGGNFSATNPMNGTPRFYRLRTGGGGTPPPVNTPPGITSQPQPRTVMQGSNATFTVTPSGTVPFSYTSRMYEACEAVFTRHAEAMQKHDIDRGYLCCTVGLAGTLLEPVLYWPHAPWTS